VICGLSGGVDSAVAAVLIHEAIGHQLTCVFVDHGLLSSTKPKPSSTCSAITTNIPIVHVDASSKFLTEFAGVTDPEQKRKTIGRLFIDVCRRREPEGTALERDVAAAPWLIHAGCFSPRRWSFRRDRTAISRSLLSVTQVLVRAIGQSFRRSRNPVRKGSKRLWQRHTPAKFV
jgi:hypothetical protein